MISIPICRRGVLRTDKQSANQCRNVGHGVYVWFVRVSVFAGYRLMDNGFDKWGMAKLVPIEKSLISPLNDFGQTIDHNEIEKAISPLAFTEVGSCEQLSIRIMRNLIAHADTLNTYFNQLQVSLVAVTDEVVNKGLQDHQGNLPDYQWFTKYAVANIDWATLHPSMDETTTSQSIAPANRPILAETYLPLLDQMLEWKK